MTAESVAKQDASTGDSEQAAPRLNSLYLGEEADFRRVHGVFFRQEELELEDAA